MATESDQYINYYVDDYITEDYYAKELYFDGDYLSPGYFQGEQIIEEASADLSTQVSINITASRTRSASANIQSNFTKQSTGGLLIIGSADFGALFTPAITVFATKTGDVLIQTETNFVAVASPIRDNDATLENIVNLSLQGDRIRFIDSNLLTESSISVTGQRTRDYQANLSTEFNQTTLLVTRFEADLSSQFTVSANAIKYQTRTNLYNRPINLDSAPYTFSTNSFEGTYSLQSTNERTEVSDEFAPLANEDFVFRFRVYGIPQPLILSYGSVSDINDSTSLTSNSSWSVGRKQIGANYYAQFSWWDGSQVQTRTSPTALSSSNWNTITVNREIGLGGIQINAGTRQAFSGAFNVPNINRVYFGGFQGAGDLFDDFIFLRDENFISVNEESNRPHTVAKYLFENNGNDEWFLQADAQADLASTTNWNLDENYILSATADLSSQSTVSAILSGTRNSSADLDSEFTQASDGIRNRFASVNAQAEAAINTVATKIVDANVQITAEIAQQTTPLRILQFDIDTDSIATQLSAVSKIGQGLITLESFITQTTTAQKTVDITESYNTEFASTTDAQRFRDITETYTAQFTQSTVNERNRATSAQLDSEFAQSTTGVKTVTPSVDLSSTTNLVVDLDGTKEFLADFDSIATQLSIVAKIGDFLIDSQTVFTQSTQAQITASAVVAVSAQFTHTTDNARIRDNEADIDTEITVLIPGQKVTDVNSDLSADTQLTADPAGTVIRITADLDSEFAQQTTAEKRSNITESYTSEFTLNVEAIAGVVGNAVIESATALSADINVIRNAEIDTDSIATQLSVINKIGQGLIGLDVFANISATAQAQAAGSSTLSAEFAQNTEEQRIRSTATSMQGAFAQSTTAQKVTEITADLSCEFTQQTTANKTAVVSALIDSAWSSTLTANVTRNNEIDTFTVTQLTVNAERTRDVSADINAVSNISVLGGTIEQFSVTLNTVSTISATVGLLTLPEELTYVVPRDVREYRILAETRAYTIETEQREYQILGG